MPFALLIESLITYLKRDLDTGGRPFLFHRGVENGHDGDSTQCLTLYLYFMLKIIKFCKFKEGKLQQYIVWREEPKNKRHYLHMSWKLLHKLTVLSASIDMNV